MYYNTTSGSNIYVDNDMWILSSGYCLGGYCPMGDFVQRDIGRGFCPGDDVLIPF